MNEAFLDEINRIWAAYRQIQIVFLIKILSNLRN